MLQATEAETDKLGARQEADLFCFTAAPLDELTPYEQYFAPLWITPFQDRPAPLLYGGGEA